MDAAPVILFCFIDWIMMLPDELGKKLIKEVCDYEEEIKMPYVTSAERFGIEKGLGQATVETRHALSYFSCSKDCKIRHPLFIVDIFETTMEHR